MKIGDEINLPFDEKGIIQNIISTIFYTKYIVKITFTKHHFNEVGDEVDFLDKQLLKIN